MKCYKFIKSGKVKVYVLVPIWKVFLNNNLKEPWALISACCALCFILIIPMSCDTRLKVCRVYRPSTMALNGFLTRKNMSQEEEEKDP